MSTNVANSPAVEDGGAVPTEQVGGKPGHLLSNTLWEIGARWGQFVGIAAVSVWVARHLGPVSYGQLAYAVSLATVLKLFSMVGAELHLKAEFMRSTAQVGVVIANAMWLRLLGSAAFYGLFTAYVLASNQGGDSKVLLLVSGSLIFCSVTDVLQSYYATIWQARTIALANITATALSIGLRVVAILMDSPLWVFGLANALELLVAGMLLAGFFFREKPVRLDWRPDWTRMRLILIQSFPLYLSAIAISIYLRADQLMIQWISSTEQLGWYAAAARVAERLHLIPVALGATFLPVIVNQKHRRKEAEYHANMQRYFDLSVMISLGLIVSYYLAGRFFVAWLLGPAYGPSVEILGILVLCVPFMALGIARGQYVVAEGWYRFAMITNICGAVVNILLNLYWIPLWGAAGAAWATLVSFFLIHVVASFLFPPTRTWGQRQLKALFLPCRPGRMILIARELVGIVIGRFNRGK